MNSVRKLRPAVIVLALLSALIGCRQSSERPYTSTSAGTTTQAAPQPVTQPQALRIAYSKLRISAPIFVASERGIFAKHGLNVKVEGFDTAQPMMQALAEGKADLGGYIALPIVDAAMLRTGKRFLYVTTMVEDKDHRISYLLRKKPAAGEKPAIRTIADLRGKTIGILPTIAYKGWLTAILQKNGLDVARDRITIQEVAPEQEVAALKDGGVDALFTNDPPATAALVSGVGELITAEPDCPKFLRDPFPFGTFIVAESWAKAHPAELRKLIAALDEAVQLVNSDPTLAKTAMVPYLPAKFQSHVQRYPDSKYWTTAQADRKAYQEITDEYVRLGIIKGPIDTAPLVVTNP